MIETTATKPEGGVDELLRSVGYDRTKAKKIRDEEVLAEFSERLREEGYSLALMNEFAARLRTKNYDPNYIAGAVAALLGRRASEAKEEYTLETQIKLIQKLPSAITKLMADELSQISLYTTSRTWASVLLIPLHAARPSPEQIGYYPEGADCIVYLPDSNGEGTIRLDSSTEHPYAIGTIYRKVRQPFHTLYLENTAQTDSYLYLLISQGGIDVEAMEHLPTSPAIYNVTMVLANREYLQVLPANTKRYTIQTRDGTAFRMAYGAGFVAAPTQPYWTVPVNTSDEERDIRPSQLTLYFACALAARVTEIKVWT